MIEILRNQEYFTEEFLIDLFRKHNYSEQNFKLLKEQNIIIKEDKYKEILINVLEKLIYQIEYGKKDDVINSIFIYSDNYGFRSINVVKAAIELEKNFLIERKHKNDMKIKFENGYVYDINTKHNIFHENIIGVNIARSKSLTSYFLQSHGIKVPKNELFYMEDLLRLNYFIDKIKYPICLKPDNLSEGRDVFPFLE